MSAEAKRPAGDPRIDILLGKAFALFGYSKVKWDKFRAGFSADEPSSRALDWFLNDHDAPFVFFGAGAAETVTVSKEIPAAEKLKKKGLIAYRCRGETDITKDNMNSVVLFAEISKNTVDTLSALCGGVYQTALDNPQNQKGWSDLIRSDLVPKFHSFLATLQVTTGSVEGKTLLPLPSKENLSNSTGGSKDRIHGLESAVIMWTKEIRHVLALDPEDSLKAGKHPEPTAEIDFWKIKASNLDSILSQLASVSAERVLEILEQNNSTYVSPFRKLHAEAKAASEEANDNNKFLAPLASLCDKLVSDSADLADLDVLFDPILHSLLLTWKYSRFYNTPARLAIFIQQLCNALILQATRSVTGSQVFAMINGEEAAEAVDKLEKALGLCDRFKQRYMVFRGIAERQTEGGWRIQNNAVFGRLDEYRERCRDILDFTRTIVQFLRLEKVEIGGTKGRALSANVASIYAEFKSAVTLFQGVKYDILDIEAKEFESDFYKFRHSVKDLDRRLAAVLASGFDDLDTIVGRLKLFDGFEGLLERPAMQAELDRKFHVLLDQWKADLKIVQNIFVRNSEAVRLGLSTAPTYPSLPPVSAAVYFSRSLKSRATEPVNKLHFYYKLVKHKPDEWVEVEGLYESILSQLSGYEERVYSAWSAKDVSEAQGRMNTTFLRRVEKTGLVRVNFDTAISRLYREVGYFIFFGLVVPEEALAMYNKADTYREWTGQLDFTVQKYNNVLVDLLPVEEPLLEERIVKMDAVLTPGIHDLKWKDDKAVPDFLKQTQLVIGDVAAVVDQVKANLRKVSALMAKWAQASLLERKPKPMSPEEFESVHKAAVGVKHHQMTEDGKEIAKLVKDSSEALKVSKISANWKAYVDFVNNLVVEGFVGAIAVSMDYLCKTLDPLVIAKTEAQPLFDLRIELQANDVIFEPPFSIPKGAPRRTTLRSVVEGWLKDFFGISTTMQRLDTATGDFLGEMKEHFQMQCLLALVSELFESTETKCLEYRNTFLQHSYLWTSSIEDSFKKFLETDSNELVQGFAEEGVPFADIMKLIGIDMGPKLPALVKFEEQIAKFQSIQSQISSLKTPVDIHWLRINAQPVKVHLVQCASRWEQQYALFLQNYVETRIDNCSNFIGKVATGLKKSPADNPGDEKLLYSTMTDIRDVKLAMNAVKKLFDPLRGIVGMLRKYGVVVSESKTAILDQLPAKWDEVLRAAFDEKERILPLQNAEMQKIKTKIDGFANEVEAFRADFLAHCPFSNDIPSDTAYLILDDYYAKTQSMVMRAKEFNNLELLFDMAMSAYRPLKESMDDLVLLKNLWDAIGLCMSTFADWNTTLWEKINTDEMLSRVKDLTNQVKNMPKEMRGWKLYMWLNDEVKNMATVLPLVNDLHSDTMRDRHWSQLMTVTGTSFNKGPTFCFKDLLDLHLHKFADDVSEIVDQSAKEAKIDKKLTTIKTTWGKLTLEFDRAREDCPLLADLTPVIEILEAHSLEIMGMVSQGRYIEFFRATVDEWSDKLRAVDSVLAVWQKVQRNWCRLEPIFMLSDDIRSQLPEDSKKFEAFDQEWKDLMMGAGQLSNAVEICYQEGRLETLKRLNEVVETCEKSLNDYLEQKKKAFPRFYFVANQALLDILSNGNKPKVVAQYLGDCFDGIKTLNFEKAADTGKIACGMYSKDSEYVPFHEDVTLDGAVESYLLGLEKHVRKMLRDILENARNSADNWELDKPREIWLQDYCAQLALVTTQMVWTEETARAFDELEAGSETVMKDYKRVCDDRIEKLIKQVQLKLSSDLRTKVITIITIDVHARDMIEKYVQLKLTDASAFQWQSQLRFYWQMKPAASSLVSFTPPDLKTCVIRICDWTTIYGYEYVGNCGRLVITPLTDRCYITLTQALNLTMGAAPAGPAGTGKTETTKDLSRAIGLPVMVFNCSDQMSYLTTASIFMGLSQVGAWGCFDEFNRISIEVLSVVSTQVKTVLDAIKENATTFQFMDDEIALVKTTGFFITMNPGYAGRTELPENLKALFRSCAMVVPDLVFICENMLMSEGFVNARSLSRKFVCLYSLCKELLSKQMHYDWGLRAVKSLLRQAGTLKRADPDMDENPILMRALRDFNTPKIVTDDMPIFLRLIQDLFPGVTAEPKVNPDFEKVVKKIAKNRGLQADQGFVTKVVGLLDILRVRHCCFIIGPPGSSKTEVWKCLLESLKSIGEDGHFEALNPKAITSDELYGIMTKSKEWKDGAISVIMRNMSKELNAYKSTHKHKWVILDGDIDAEWIESMNTVMDDNKVLTLVSNERIPFTPSMRMLLEIQDMKHASPATVSRGGVLFINEADVGWKPYVESWREKLDPVAQSAFYLLFSNYFEANIEYVRKNFVFGCPMLDIGFVQSICCFVDALLNNNTKENMEYLKAASVDEQKTIYEAYFVFAFMWSVGGAVADDKIINYRKSFNTWMRMTFKIKFPDAGEPMDYRFEPSKGGWVGWDQYVVPFNPVAERMYQTVIVSNTEIERLKYCLRLHSKRGKPVLYCGISGTAKSTIVRDFLSELKDDMLSASVNLNSYTDSYSLQLMMEGYLEKRTGRTFGPPGNRKCQFFIDDLNMPSMDKYDTQSAIMLLFQMISHGSIYDRAHLEERKDLVDTQFVACMNPKAGSFMINARLQRHFTVLSTYAPSGELITQIYSQILTHHLQSFESSVQKMQDSIVNATIDTLTSILNQPCFLPSAKKFHYMFNLKDVSNIFQSLLNTKGALYRGGAAKYLRVWVHECHRIFGDRLILESDQTELKNILEKVAKKHFVGVPPEELFGEDLTFTSFVSVHGGNEKQYLQSKDSASLKKVLEEKLAEYNETFAEMNLVLFDAAIAHICRICRVIDLPCGHALLIGVGGSGKTSLSRLACFINQTDVLSILVNQSYGMAEFKIDLQEFCKKAAVKPGTPQAFLLTDGQIANERFLVYINDLLASGSIPDLFTREEYDGIFSALRNQAKAAGVPDDRGAMMNFFIERVRRNLHVILCHSPVGDTFRIRGRKFPALVSCMIADVFHPWPRNALNDVAVRFLSDVSLPDNELLGKLSASVAEMHLSIDAANSRFLAVEARHNYTTPKSFLELISFYKALLTKKRAKLDNDVQRLEKGLTIMEQVRGKVEGLKEDLRKKMVQVEEKKTATNALISQVTVASEKAAAEKAVADEEAVKANALASDAAAIKATADKELQEALPAMERAKDAVNCLTKPAIQELKSLGKPPPECAEVTKCVLIMLKNEKKNLDWKAAQKMMGNPGAFLEEVAAFNANEIAEWVLDMLAPILQQPFFNYETMKGKSVAAAYLCNWVINIVAYNKIYKRVAPLMAKVKEATSAKEGAEAALGVVLARVKEVQEKVAALEKQLREAVDEKEKTEKEAEGCLNKLQLAERLVNGLADEYARWKGTVANLQAQGVTVIGDSLLASAFVGYISPFSASFRTDLWQNVWSSEIKSRGIPHVEGVDPLYVLASEADIASWKNEGLPADRMSIENAAVVNSCSRWPLIIDPQLQGVKWIKSRFGETLTVIQLNQPNWLQKVLMTISMGGKLLIEAVGQEIDAILEPLLARSVIRRGKTQLVIKIGGEEVDYDPKFQLFLQSKLSNPHYRPEIAAQCTIVNFIVTPDGLEDQILAMVVNVEKPELEKEKQELVRKQNEYMVTLAQLEDDLLAQLSAADPATILDNFPLIEGLEVTKKTAKEINEQVIQARKTEEQINIQRENYREVAQEASMLFFLIIQLNEIEHMYQYSLDSFVSFLFRAIDRTEDCETVPERVIALIAMIRMTIFRWVARGLFEKHKLIFCAMLAFKLLQRGLLHEQYSSQFYQFLLRGSLKLEPPNPIDWLPAQNWFAVQKLIELPGFETFAQNMEKDAPTRFKEWFNELQPEDVKLPLDWKRLDTLPLQKLLVLRCLRPDRMTMALANWIRNSLPDGKSFMDCDSSLSFFEVLSSSFEDSSNTTPIFFILSAGADPVKEVEALGRKLVGLQINVNYHNVAMGQGQDVVAMAKLDLGHREGHWVMLQNIHLMPRWCTELEKKLDAFILEGSHPGFRCFLSADPSSGIPIGVLERSIKLTNEPPQGLVANLRRAFAFFPKESFEEKDSKVKSILFGLCHFHAVLLERKKFGPLGYNMNYPFAIGDLRDSASVLNNYLENAGSRVPFDDLRYIFGEILYGGHIVDDWDRKLCRTYLEYYMQEPLLDETELVPYSDKLSWHSPVAGAHERYLDHIETMPPENPIMFGLHPNAEVGFRTAQCNMVFEILKKLDGRSGGGKAEEEGEAAAAVQTPMQRAEQLCGEILDEVKDIRFSVEDISRSIPEEEKGPYQFVFLQECEYMNSLVKEMVRSLAELQLGFKGELTMSETMERLVNCLYMEVIPPRWQKLAFPSTRPLSSWLVNLKDRCSQLDEWTADPTNIPKVVDLSKLFNPQSFLTAIKQICCQQQMLELDKLMVFTEVTKRDKSQVEAAAREGAYVTGMFLEGARWDVNMNSLEESRPKEMFYRMPVINCKAGIGDEALGGSGKDTKNLYICPTYCTPNRRPNYVFSAQLRTKHNPAKWVLGGVAMILDVGTSI